MKEEQQFMQHYRNYMAPECRAQMPAFNRVGRGLQGNAFDVQADVEDGEVVLRGQYIDARTGDHSENVFEVNLTESTPQLQFRQHNPAYRWKQNAQDVVEVGWFIHFRYFNKAENAVLWEFDTPFTKTGEYQSSTIPQDVIDRYSY